MELIQTQPIRHTLIRFCGTRMIRPTTHRIDSSNLVAGLEGRVRDCGATGLVTCCCDERCAKKEDDEQGSHYERSSPVSH